MTNESPRITMIRERISAALAPEDLEIEEAPAARRTTTVTASRSVQAEEESEGMGLRAAMILTSLLMIVSVPVCIAAASGNITAIVRGIAGIFGEIPG